MTAQPLKSRAVFLLGAGASVPANVPTTSRFATGFRDSLSPERREQLEPLWRDLLRWTQTTGVPLDVELLYDILQRLATSEKDFLAARAQSAGEALSGELAKGFLKSLEQFILGAVIVDSGASRHLEALRYFVPPDEPLDVFTTNYDTCVEVLTCPP